MRKSFLLILLLISLVARAQDSTQVKKNEILVGVGSELFLSDTSWDDGVEEKNITTFFVGYMRRLSKVWSLGVCFSYFAHDSFESSGLSYVDSNGNYIGSDDHWENQKYFALMANLKAKWARFRWCDFYSRVGCGPYIELNKSDDGTKRTEFYLQLQQITPVGFEFGSDDIRCFMELGLGIQGVVNIGLSHTF